ncbi:hypothetical protein [Pseudoroseicyclus tamaricis]|uniref:Uncharacterized protein n=1 Tax=Pseudoroseicyclus tamaricis TaxID=2705421 RepID=A0A6B2JLA8_9RHOB|nr:hypothetical protein [Pseudoroseicyclus tamaricis]NDV02341.1 hypothetical protein [Pseudoroseicyclus tamaricis]
MKDDQSNPFRFVGRAGLGKPDATLAHAMCWFEGRFYLGTTTPKCNGPEDRARIMTHDPETGEWEVLFESPLLESTEECRARVAARSGEMGKRMAPPEAIAREFGVRSMAVFQGKGDPKPCLYAGVMSVWGGLVLRSEDGRTFEPVTEHGIDNDTYLSFRGLTPFEGKLFTSPAGTTSRDYADLNYVPNSLVYVSADPAGKEWQLASTEGFGDETNSAVFSLCAAHGWLYAGTANEKTGFQLYRTKAEGKAPYQWEKVLDRGAWRYHFNLSTSAMAEFGGDLYVGSGISGLGYDREFDIGPCAGELMRVHEDGTWHLIFGEPRITPDGLKIPLSGYGPGMNDPYNSVVWAMAEHEGRLYFGTHIWEPFDYAINGGGESLRGGYQLWSSADGEEWRKEIDEGFGSVTSTGLRTLQSTPNGLYVGTCVHTKLIAFQAKRHSGIQDINHPSCGFDVLLGH